ncbi:MAG: RIP metalloprotease RseP [Prevotellaceae bacterium]|jgi:regulator of sigma E protease|nr:RIP metalloprotease RseP [Prevotellaceae bacterium]
MEIIIKASQLILSLSVLIIVHEFGHFFFARLFKIRTEKFYLFFNPSFSIVRIKRIDKKWRFSWFSKNPPESWDAEHADKTEWGLGWLPLGGYCKIAGMIDESMDTEHLRSEAQCWEFRSKPAWQRLFVMIGGVLFNVILAFVVYAGVLCKWGDDYVATRDVQSIMCDSVALEMGFQNGDKILSVNGKPVERFSDVQKRIALYRETEITVEREGKTKIIDIDYYKYASYLAGNIALFPSVPFVIDQVSDSSINRDSGLSHGDVVIGIDNIRSNNMMVIKGSLSKYKNSEVGLTVIRQNDTLAIPVKINEQGLMGVRLKAADDQIPVVEQRYGLLSAFPAGVQKAKNRIKDQLYELRLMVTPKTKAYAKVGSLLSIGNAYNSSWDWHRFWNVTALLSIMLAVLNLLPIPALDGGHVMFAIYEIVTRHKPSDKFLIRAQVFGMVILLIIMVFALGNDIKRLIFR